MLGEEEANQGVPGTRPEDMSAVLIYIPDAH
jgi:hypothetical protein